MGSRLRKGIYNFVLRKGTKGPTAGANVRDGKFMVSREKGSFAGKFSVSITASRLSDRKMLGPNGMKLDTFEQYIPDRYNDNTELAAEVIPGEDNKFTFEITSK